MAKLGAYKRKRDPAKTPEPALAKLSGSDQQSPAVRPPGDAQQSPGQRSTRQSLGVTVQTLTPELAKSMNVTDPNLKGVVVSSSEVHAPSLPT